MNGYEQGTQKLSEGAEVHQLEARMSAVETYKAFYSIYGQADFLDTNSRLSCSLLLPGRALYCDESGDAATHVIVREYNDAPWYPSRKMLGATPSQRMIPYDPGSFVVVTSDGDSIDRWHVLAAHGIYDGEIDAVVNQYNSGQETIFMDLKSADSQMRRKLQFNRANSTGTMTLRTGNVGWILDQRATELQMARIMEPVQAIGHIATAS